VGWRNFRWMREHPRGGSECPCTALCGIGLDEDNGLSRLPYL
jgi:hypothetical protein